MKLIDKQILYVIVGLNQAIRGLKKDKNSHWRNKNYNLLKRKLEDLEFQKGVNKFQEVLNEAN
ncbi:MAG: hypothetical protein ACRC7S_16640 [Cetobacterium sp.]